MSCNKNEQKEMVDIEIELDPEEVEFIEKNNIDLSKFIQKRINELIKEREVEDIAKLKELMKKYPEIVKAVEDEN